MTRANHRVLFIFFSYVVFVACKYLWDNLGQELPYPGAQFSGFLPFLLNAVEKFLLSSYDFVLPTFMPVNGFHITDSLVISLSAISANGCFNALSRLLRIGI